jgi:hypothetical protein
MVQGEILRHKRWLGVCGGCGAASPRQPRGAPAYAKASARSRRSARREGGSACARKTDPPALAHDAAPARVFRSPVRDRLDSEVVRGPRDDSCASADGCAYGAVFRTDAARCPHRAAGLTWTRRRRPAGRLEPKRPDCPHRAAAEPCQGPGAMRPARCCRAGAWRRRGSSEKCTAGVPTRRGSDSPRTERPTRRPTLIISQRTAIPSRDGIVRHAPEVHFSGRRPRRRGPEVAPPPTATRSHLI